jgi:hypothetical protein
MTGKSNDNHIPISGLLVLSAQSAKDPGTRKIPENKERPLAVPVNNPLSMAENSVILYHCLHADPTSKHSRIVLVNY